MELKITNYVLTILGELDTDYQIFFYYSVKLKYYCLESFY